jgi:hypothetical protein
MDSSQIATVVALWIGIASSVAGGLVVLFIQWASGRIQERGAPFTGTWYATIYDDAGVPIKRDIVDVRQRGERLEGTIRRKVPIDQHEKKWQFRARCRSNVIFGMFWSLDTGIVSFGTFTLRYADDGEYHGFYMRHLSKETALGTHEDKILRIRYDWSRKPWDGQ